MSAGLNDTPEEASAAYQAAVAAIEARQQAAEERDRYALRASLTRHNCGYLYGYNPHRRPTALARAQALEGLKGRKVDHRGG